MSCMQSHSHAFVQASSARLMSTLYLTNNVPLENKLVHTVLQHLIIWRS